MCGIAGFQGRFDPSLLAAMGSALAHRGPDGAGEQHWAEPSGVQTGFAHRRLSIIDLSAAGAQPLTVDCPSCGAHGHDQLSLTYNGELYNYRELRVELEGRGHRFITRTDSEVLLHLYAEAGPSMLDRMNGIFAFAIRDGRPAADGRHPGDVFIARDALGVKPLYLAESRDGVLFASELKALLAWPGLSRTIDIEAMHEHLAFLWTPAPRTLLREVRKLEPGCALILRGGAVTRRWRWYELPYGEPAWTVSPDLLAEQLRGHVETAVRRQLVADVPVGAFLSGGLDSSAVVAMMRRAMPNQRIDCFGIGFVNDEQLDDSPADLPYARAVARHLGVDLTELVVGPDLIDELPHLLWLLDEPQADPAPLNALRIARCAREGGITVLLSGAGGDDILGGYRRHWALQAERTWGWLPHFVRAGLAGAAERVALGRGPFSAREGLSRRLAKAFLHAGDDGDRRLAAYFLWSPDAMRNALYAPEVAAQLAGRDARAPLLEALERIPGERDPLNRMLFLEGKHFLTDHNLNYTDKVGMAAGVEVRVPLLDLDLVRFAARVPSEWKQRGSVGKPLFKKAMEPFLPHDVIYRPKAGFGAPIRRWLQRELRPLVDDVLGREAVQARGLFDHGAVHRLIAADRAGRVDGAYTIFALVCLELWFRRFVDRR